MLNFLRKKGNIKKIMWGLAILIVPAFVLWGSGSAIRSKGLPKYAGRIFGRKVSFRQYEQALLACRNQGLLMYGDKFTQVAKYLNLENQAWEQLILLHRARLERIRVSNQEVVDTIRAMALFQEEGKFSQEKYNILLDYVFRTNPRDFEEQIRELLMIERLTDKVTQDVDLSDEEIEKAYQEDYEKATAEYILIEPQNFTEQIHLSYEELQEYYANYKEHFQKPEQVNVEYVGLYFEQGQEEEKDAKEEDAEESKQALEERLWEIADQMEEAESFETVAAEHQLEVKETGFFARQEAIPEIGLSYEFSNTAFSLEIGELSNIIETPQGYFIIKVKGKRESYIPPLEEVKEKLKLALVEEKSWEIAKTEGGKTLSQIKELIQKENLSFLKAAEKLSLEVKQTEEFTRTSYIAGIGQSGEFAQGAFSLNSGEVSNLITVPNGYAILSLKDIVPIDQEKFAQEKEVYSQRVLARKKASYFKDWMDNLKESANLVSNLDKLKQQPSP